MLLDNDLLCWGNICLITVIIVGTYA